jgi:hypothetical protein
MDNVQNWNSYEKKYWKCNLIYVLKLILSKQYIYIYIYIYIYMCVHREKKKSYLKFIPLTSCSRRQRRNIHLLVFYILSVLLHAGFIFDLFLCLLSLTTRKGVPGAYWLSARKKGGYFLPYSSRKVKETMAERTQQRDWMLRVIACFIQVTNIANPRPFSLWHATVLF